MRQPSLQNERVLITRSGGADVLQVVQAATHTPQRGQVLIRVEAAGVSFADVLMRRGLNPNIPRMPFVPGYDVVGIVEQVGVGVIGLAAGDRVAALTEIGGYSRYVRVAAWRCVPVPSGVKPTDAAATVLNYTAAFQMLHRISGVQSGDSVLIHGAAGGIGTALLQLGKLANLNCYGTASRSKHPVVERYGGTPIDYHREDFGDRLMMLSGDGVDYVFDPIGGNHWLRSYWTLHLGGTLVIYGASTALQNGERNPASLLPGMVKLGTLLFLPDGRRIVGYYLPQYIAAYHEMFREDLTILLQMLKDERIQPHIGAIIPLNEAARAHELLEASAISGKIVLVPDIDQA